MSYRRMTKPERKKHIRRKYRSFKEKVFVFSSFVIVLVVLVTAFIASIQQNFDPILPILIFAGIIVFGMVALLFVDMIFWESE